MIKTTGIIIIEIVAVINEVIHLFLLTVHWKLYEDVVEGTHNNNKGKFDYDVS